MATTYLVEKMRVTEPEGKVAERNPDRILTVSGNFFATTEGKGGAIEKGEKLTFTSKYLDLATVQHEDFVLDQAKGILTLPEGRRGREAAESLSVDAVNAILARARASAEGDASAES